MADEKKRESAGADSRLSCPVPVWGEGPGQNATYCITANTSLRRRLSQFRFSEQAGHYARMICQALLSRHRVHRDRVAIKSSGNRRRFARLLVENGERCLIRGIQSVNLFADNQRVLAAMPHAGARALRSGRFLHVLPAAHRVAHLASKSTLAEIGRA